jgi:hypothetical protein
MYPPLVKGAPAGAPLQKMAINFDMNIWDKTIACCGSLPVSPAIFSYIGVESHASRLGLYKALGTSFAGSRVSRLGLNNLRHTPHHKRGISFSTASALKSIPG